MASSSKLSWPIQLKGVLMLAPVKDAGKMGATMRDRR
jgi:hypothetical protein